MLGLFLLILFLAGLFAAFSFTKTSKVMPKNWYEWKMELRYQYLGIIGLIDDFLHRNRDSVTLYKQPGRVAVITGGNRGIGLRIVEKLLACDMTVVMGVRDPSGAERAVGELVNLKTTGGKLICEQLDVGDLSSVKEFASKIKAQFNKIDILINNAGIMFAPHKLTVDKHESQFAINYLGHFLLTHLLLPQLRAAGREDRNARIVNVSSCAHLIGRINYNDINGVKKYNAAAAYSQSKLAQILSTLHLQRLIKAGAGNDAYVQVLAVHPGIVDTDLFEHSATTAVPFFKKLIFKTPERGSRTIVYAAIEPKLDGQGAVYLSNCAKATVHPYAKSLANCEKFFEFSCDLLGIKAKDYGNGKI